MIIDYNTVTVVDHNHCAFAVAALAIKRDSGWFIFKPRQHVITLVDGKRAGGNYGVRMLMHNDNLDGDCLIFDTLTDDTLQQVAEWMSSRLQNEPSEYDKRKALEFLQASLMVMRQQFDGP